MIDYDLFPKYCKTYKLQGHDKMDCIVLHPELNPPLSWEKEIKDNHSQKVEAEVSKSKTYEGRWIVPNLKWNPTRRFINKGHLSVRALSPDKGLCDNNILNTLTEDGVNTENTNMHLLNQ